MKQAAGRYHFDPSRRRWGQNFLRDRTVADRIVAAIDPRGDDLFLEIGPGEGVLTERLAGRARGVAAVEIDPLLASILREGLARRYPKLKVLEADALKVTAEAVFDLLGQPAAGGGKLRLAGNLPFNVSVPLVRLWMDRLPLVRDMTFMVQREVARRMTARPSTSEYGFLSLVVQQGCSVRPLLEVSREAFRPRPRVDAAVVRLTPLEEPARTDDQRRGLLEVVSIAFRSRRKTLFNNLRADKRFAGDAELLSELFHQLGLDRDRRGETLSLEEFAALAAELALLEAGKRSDGALQRNDARGNDAEEK
jgi:16S rRNA (adenine1518-N6/adenine1519-N6)-dimethyltransferase